MIKKYSYILFIPLIIVISLSFGQGFKKQAFD